MAVSRRAGGADRIAVKREAIDRLDERLQSLIRRRAQLARDIASLKRRADHSGQAAFYRPEREAQVLTRVLARPSDPMAPSDMARLFREIMSACLAVETSLRVGYLGPVGTYTEQAAHKHFGQSVELVPCASIDAVFREVESGALSLGVVPIENSSEGSVTHTLDRLARSEVRICGEVELRIRHSLLGRDNRAIRMVKAHPQALAQCRLWLDVHVPESERVPVASNAEGARLARRERGTVAIGPRSAAAHYGLKVLAAGIEDEPHNATRFLVIGGDDPPPTGKDKTTILFATANRPGALAALLAPLARKRISLSRIESRPARRGSWEYVFFVDLEGHIRDRRIAAAVRELERHVTSLKWLGSYPRAVL